MKLRRIFGRRKRTLLIISAMFGIVVAIRIAWRLSKSAEHGLMLPETLNHDLSTFVNSRSLAHYMDNIKMLIDPPETICESSPGVPLIVMVNSAPWNEKQRQAIRTTYATLLPTFFIVGLSKKNRLNQLVENYVEAEKHGDMIMYDFIEDYQNLTLKTALMMRWILKRCPQVGFMFKTDDDRMLNPWGVMGILKDHGDKQMLGFAYNNHAPHRDAYNKWYVPRWLYPADVIPTYLSGCGYFINGKYIRKVYEAALKVPMINLEDVYFTYIVGHQHLSYPLTHDRRLNLERPWLPFPCSLWNSVNSERDPGGMTEVWRKIKFLGALFESGNEVCKIYTYVLVKFLRFF